MAGEVRLELTTCGFGDRRSSQLSYSPDCKRHLSGSAGLFVDRVLPFKLAILLLFQALGRVTLLFHRRIITPLALGAFQNNQFTHIIYPRVTRNSRAAVTDGPGDFIGTG